MLVLVLSNLQRISSSRRCSATTFIWNKRRTLPREENIWGSNTIKSCKFSVKMEIPSHFSNRSPRVKFWPWWSQGNLHSLSLRQEPSLITSYTCNCEMWKGKEKLFPWVLPWGNTFSRQWESPWEMIRKEIQKCRKSEMGNRQGSSNTEHFQSWTGTTVLFERKWSSCSLTWRTLKTPHQLKSEMNKKLQN